jgi:hypothetical protein
VFRLSEYRIPKTGTPNTFQTATRIETQSRPFMRADGASLGKTHHTADEIVALPPRPGTLVFSLIS